MSPATAGTAPEPGDAEALDRTFARLHAASRREPAPDLAARRALLDALRRLVMDNRDAIALAISADFGNRSLVETELLEVVPTLNALRHTRRHVAGWMKPRRRRVDLTFRPAQASVRQEPLGVVGIIAPWNYPLLLTLSPLVDALAAGNRALIKPSELSPRFSALLQSLVAGAFPPDRVAVVMGGPDVARRLCALPFDHLIFTGSTAVGREVMRAASANLVPVTLELGGKSPAILCPGADTLKAARSIAFGKFVNAGQTCIAPDYALVPRAEVARFAEAVMAQARRSYPEVARNADYTSIATPRHHERLTRAVAEAEAGGARVFTHADAGCADARKLGPTVVLDTPENSTLMREEIFGPVLPVVGYDTVEEALAFVAARERPLALYVFGGDAGLRGRVLDGALSGGVTVNGTLLHIAQNALPFGGVGPSGFGSYHGHDGFLRLSHARGVYEVGFFNAFERLGPPWGRLARTMAKLLTRS